jgi:arsenite methyltransferase
MNPEGVVGGGCSCGSAPLDITEASKLIGYDLKELAGIPQEANMGLGCGNPLAIADLREGETVLDLGSGGGLDCFLARQKGRRKRGMS